MSRRRVQTSNCCYCTTADISVWTAPARTTRNLSSIGTQWGSFIRHQNAQSFGTVSGTSSTRKHCVIGTVSFAFWHAKVSHLQLMEELLNTFWQEWLSSVYKKSMKAELSKQLTTRSLSGSDVNAHNTQCDKLGVLTRMQKLYRLSVNNIVIRDLFATTHRHISSRQGERQLQEKRLWR